MTKGGLQELFITLEEHFVTPVLANETINNPVLQLSLQVESPMVGQRLPDAGDLRLNNMTDNGIRKQVLSAGASPAAMNDTAGCMAANNQMAATVETHPDRFNAFAILPMSFPNEAAAELERAVTQLGFPGALIDNHLPNGTFYDGPEYDVFWAKAVELNVPIYVHPTFPDISAVTGFGGKYAPIDGDYIDPVAALLGTAAWGWHQSTGLHFLRLYSAGVFVRFPKLKIILGHMGEMLPFYLERADSFLTPANPDKPTLIDTYHQNIWVTTAGLFSTNPMATMLRNTAIDRIMYSVDYPFGNSVNGLNFMADLLLSGLITPEQWEQIAFSNAEALLGIQ
ncbi:hypothetical protein F5884DRAFT_825483 [Xylogone sp. PMI_703]|nr:hypothetical protein F5884DRAFT_825483 [Xylogone sp. PMI_703]